VIVSGLILVAPAVARSSPGLVHFGPRLFSDYTPKERELLMPLLSRMAGWLSVALNAFSFMGIHMQIAAALAFPPRVPIPWWVGGMLITFAVIIYYYLQRFDEETGRDLD